MIVVDAGVTATVAVVTVMIVVDAMSAATMVTLILTVWTLVSVKMSAQVPLLVQSPMRVACLQRTSAALLLPSDTLWWTCRRRWIRPSWIACVIPASPVSLSISRRILVDHHAISMIVVDAAAVAVVTETIAVAVATVTGAIVVAVDAGATKAR